jgi:glutamate synthase domain-containing protein 3
MNKEKLAFDMYKSGKDITTIASSLNISRGTIYNYKKKHNWDTKVLFEITDFEDLEAREKKFLATLIQQWESNFDSLKDMELSESLEILEKYTKLYYKLKASKDNPTIQNRNQRKVIAKDVIQKLSAIAVQKEANCVIEFISNNADAIIDDLIRSI